LDGTIIIIIYSSTYTPSLGTRKPTWCPGVSLLLITQDHWIGIMVSVDRD